VLEVDRRAGLWCIRDRVSERTSVSGSSTLEQVECGESFPPLRAYCCISYAYCFFFDLLRVDGRRIRSQSEDVHRGRGHNPQLCLAPKRPHLPSVDLPQRSFHSFSFSASVSIDRWKSECIGFVVDHTSDEPRKTSIVHTENYCTVDKTSSKCLSLLSDPLRLFGVPHLAQLVLTSVGFFPGVGGGQNKR
jgi:hypothetical protein